MSPPSYQRLLDDGVDERKLSYGTLVSESSTPYEKPPKFYFPRRFFMLILGNIGLTICYLLRVNVSVAIIPMSTEYGWSDNFKGFVLSAFFMGYLVLQMPATFLCNKFGGKRVFLVGVTISIICTIFVPLAAQNRAAMMICRILTGITQSIAFPTMNWLIKRWFPVTQRSASASLIWSGVYLGTILGDIITPNLVAKYNWQMSFYLFSGLGMLWSLAWLILIKDEPKSVWGIHPSEVYMINSEYEHDRQSLLLNNPSYEKINNKDNEELGFLEVCKYLFKESGIYAILLYNLTTSWGYYLLLMWYPTWLQREIGLSVGNEMAFFTALPYIVAFVISNVCGTISDRLLKRGFRKIILRKFFGVMSTLIPGVGLILINWVPMEKALKLFVMTVSISATGYSSVSSQIATIDLSPNNAVIVMGIANFVGTIPGVLGPLCAGLLLAKFGSWVYIFLICSVCYFFAMTVWVLFAKTDKVI
ncbi:hypothetical protein PPL_07798 [Heterostelium album PN500]|uniref:Major facilitator superfamily (MFS) profile domain-containing protein n=1 Tax=Heterostelium pallidum (strain ATCC 26659 / Pp 5 / PN500) TaxID=670386 RepID=D3BGZ6_HETP5|nr:hypothetical protein PPL_07798 [Heterostelium album PN500]EFA79380.1 hypothetical protein PPL_07798 [Heterostelium album PN500]|eukprot:XP_020431501.1 hypothetical protein PPL_07798 [Heterostelium album PN500]